MRTSKPIATISYNEPDFLQLKLEELRRAGRLSEWYFIKHTAEEDETKDHIHLFVVPSKMLQTDDLIKEFSQPDPTKPGKVLTCPRWVSSKFGDWYLYAVHDLAYLTSKGQSRKYHYRLQDVVAFDYDALNDSVREIDLTTVNAIKRMMDAQQAGLTFGQFLQRGGVPIQAIRAYEEAWEVLHAADSTYRASRVGHDTKPAQPSDEPLQPSDFDPITGEYVGH